MIRFRCHRCKRPIAAPDGHVGKKVKCPGCMIVTIVPDIPGAQAAKAKAARPSRTAPPPVPKGPPNPLDELAAAMGGGEVETASFDDQYTQYDQVEVYDGVDAKPYARPTPAPARQKPARPVWPPMGGGGVLLCLFLPLIGLIVGLARPNKRAGSQMVMLSVCVIAISLLLAVIIRIMNQQVPT